LDATMDDAAVAFPAWYFTLHGSEPVELPVDELGNPDLCSLDPAALVWTEGLTEWLSAASLAEYFPEGSDVPIVAPPEQAAAAAREAAAAMESAQWWASGLEIDVDAAMTPPPSDPTDASAAPAEPAAPAAPAAAPTHLPVDTAVAAAPPPATADDDPSPAAPPPPPPEVAALAAAEQLFDLPRGASDFGIDLLEEASTAASPSQVPHIAAGRGFGQVPCPLAMT
jgi:hypothetical protein